MPKTVLSRRQMLRGSSVLLGLPLLEAMMATSTNGTVAATAANIPTRVGFFYVPNGVNMHDWRIAEAGKLKTLSPILQPLEPVRNRLTVVSNLEAEHCTGRGAGHEPAGGGFLVGQRCKHSEAPEVGGISIDQAIARHSGLQTPVDSLTMGIDPGHAGDHGYSGTYLSHISWRGKQTPAPLEINPQQLFQRLYQGKSPQRNLRGNDSNQPADLEKNPKASVIDFILEDARSLQSQLGYSDRQRLEDYIDGVRGVEKRVQAATRDSHSHHEGSFDSDPELDGVYRTIAGHMPKDSRGIPSSYTEHVSLMLDIMALAFQADTTRVASFMFSYEKSGRAYKEIDISGAHHSLSHHGNEEKNLSQLTKINTLHIDLFSKLLQRLDQIPEGNGTVLDNCLFLYGSGISDGNKHNHDDLPILLAGGGGCNLQGNRHLQLEKKRPLCDVYLTMAQCAGIPMDQFGDSQKPLAL